MRNSLRRTLISFIVPVILICIWTIFANKIDNPIILPKLSQVLSNFIHATDDFIGLGSLPKNISVSIIRVMLGYLVGIIVALPLGIFMGYKEKINLLFSKTINIIRPVPALGWVPLILAWFGTKSLATLFKIPYGTRQVFFNNFKFSMIFIIAIGTFFPVVSSSAFGVRNVPKTLIESAKVLGASKRDIFFKILIPGAGPNIIYGLRGGLGSAWACLVAAEMLPGSLSGVGYLITHSYELARIDLVVTGIICIGLVGSLLDYIFIVIENRYFSWLSRR
ncbi:ABC transporter permease [Tissierella praeacuta]|uniref:ABC transporter permease n=1 Tax=Tissierella praeacuta TaxID=43131 RepID=UPI003DA2727E